MSEILNGTTHEQAIMCRQLFTGHVMGSRPIERKKTTVQMIIAIIIVKIAPSQFNVRVAKNERK